MMKQRLGFLAVFTGVLVFLITFAAPLTHAGPKVKVDVCHIPPGNPDNFHTIKINENAVPAHLAHGDVLGVCEDVGPLICNDDNMCTVDDFNPGTLICQIDVPLDCDDNDPATTDSCASASGCINTPIPPEIFCDDSNPCTIDEYIGGSSPLVCLNANPVICDDGDDTTRDTCNTASGCMYTPIVVVLPVATAQPQNVTLVDETPITITLVGSVSDIGPGESLNFSTTQGANGSVSVPVNVVLPDSGFCSTARSACSVDNDCPGVGSGETCDLSAPASTTATVIYTPSAPPLDDSFEFTVELNGAVASATVTIFEPGTDTLEDPPGISIIEATGVTLEVTEFSSVDILLQGTAPNGTGDLSFNVISGPTLGGLGPIVPINPHAVFSEYGSCSTTTTQACGGTLEACPTGEQCQFNLIGYEGICSNTTFECTITDPPNPTDPCASIGEICVLPAVRSASTSYTNSGGTAPTTDVFTFQACETTNCSTAAIVNINIDTAMDIAVDKELSGDLNQPIPFTIP